MIKTVVIFASLSHILISGIILKRCSESMDIVCRALRFKAFFIPDTLFANDRHVASLPEIVKQYLSILGTT